ncbi:MAG TPA: YdhR family protein [Sphingomonadaceae bacterium]|nr:YdhR family protein [Sphingomonadaceae bacterium]
MFTVIVKYPLPVPIPRDVMMEEFRDAEARFTALPGLIRKYFCYDEASHTGHSVYLWESEEQARAFHGKEFERKMVEVFDAPPECIFADTLLIVDNEQKKVIAN